MGVGLAGHDVGAALVGQSFLSKLDVALSGLQMILPKK